MNSGTVKNSRYSMHSVSEIKKKKSTYCHKIEIIFSDIHLHIVCQLW